MAVLVAIGYDDETTAAAAADEVRSMSKDLVIEPDAIAVISRDAEGRYHVTTSHHPVGEGASWEMCWRRLGNIEMTRIDEEFREQVRDMVWPGSSALFLIVEKVTPDKAVDRLSRFGGTVLRTPVAA